MLQRTSNQHLLSIPIALRILLDIVLPDLQRPRAKNARPFVLGHKRGRQPLVVRDLLVAMRRLSAALA